MITYFIVGTCSFFPLALLQYVRGILLGRKNRSVLFFFFFFFFAHCFLPHQKMVITAKVIERQNFKFAIICCLPNVVCEVIKERKWKRAQIARVLRRLNVKAIMHLLKAIMHL